ncbi:hypothetical protein DET54_12271 [Paenibacillus pabuli]|uniref:Uncharacterized protein n=1 Tax=Paenibacillus pabuli TaxID=1472 RepID=A0ABX9BCA3_9BACL|nr:hypothetical protein [Paenibacillus pabuli]RAI85098.1 hypothetical protein DET54_12271 [Paenibacillus pabuli]
MERAAVSFGGDFNQYCRQVGLSHSHRGHEAWRVWPVEAGVSRLAVE